MRKLFIILSLVIGTLLLFNCKKDHNRLGVEVQPDIDRVNAEAGQNFPVYAHTISYDSIVSVNTDLKFLGSNYDGVMGKLDIGLYLNANMSVSNVNFYDSVQSASSEISLRIKAPVSAHGHTNSAVTFSVFVVTGNLKYNVAYYTKNKSLHDVSQMIGTKTYTVFPTLTIKIPIDKAFTDAVMSNTSALVGNSAFQQTYKGFYIQSSLASGTGWLAEVDLAADSSGYFLYYKPSPSKAATNFKFDFVGPEAAHYNTVAFQPALAVNNQLTGDTAAGANKLYLKGMGATRLKVQIPFLKNYGDTFKVAVNRAEVIFKVDPSYLALTSGEYFYNVPPKLALLAMDSLGREILTLDQRNTSYLSRYEGSYDTDKKEYRFNIPLHAQAILNGTRKNYGFYLAVADPTPPFVIRRDGYFQGVVLEGSNSTLKPVLNLNVVRFKND